MFLTLMSDGVNEVLIRVTRVQRSDKSKQILQRSQV